MGKEKSPFEKLVEFANPDNYEEVLERMKNPIKSTYMAQLESSGWTFVENHCFKNFLDDIIILEKMWGEDDSELDDMFLNREPKDYLERKKELIGRMKNHREHLKKIYDVEKVLYARAYTIFGERIPSSELIAAIYIKRKLH